MADRRKEIEDIKEENRAAWLAGELDGVEQTLTDVVKSNTEAMEALKSVLTGLLVMIAGGFLLAAVVAALSRLWN